MPELPEVETLRLQLTQFLVGLTIKDLQILNPKSFVGERRLVVGAEIKDVRRFAKILLIDLSNNFSLAAHLKLTGQLIYRGEKQPKKLNIVDPLLQELPNKHTRVIITFTNGDRLFFNDLRIFGWMKIVKKDNVNDLIEKLGPEPMRDLTLGKFVAILSSSKKPIKLVLMDQEKISGVGNIYANEALFLAGINPTTPANKVSEKKARALFNKLLQVLKKALQWRGASEDSFRDALGQMGEVQEHFLVYSKKGEKCPNNCGSRIKRIELGGRGTFFCPKCQNNRFLL